MEYDMNKTNDETNGHVNADTNLIDSSNTNDNSWTYVGVLIDVSGSMESLNPKNTSSQLTGLIKEQTGGKVTVTAARFNEKYEVFIENKNASEVNITEQDIKPDGCTALYESFCKIIDDVDNSVKNMTVSKPDKVVIIVLTDGEENSSKGIYANNSGRELLNQKIKEKQETNWIFYFLGTNIDAIKTGAGLGIAQQTCINYTPSQVGCTNVIKSTSEALKRARFSKGLRTVDIIQEAAFTNIERVNSNQ